MTERDMRVGDVERDQTASLLAEHFAAGRLSRAEFDQRTTDSLAARTRGELDHVMVDLPAMPSDRAPAPVLSSPPEDVVASRARIAHWRKTSLAPWAIFSVFFVVLWAVTGGGYFWAMWPIMGWGLGVALSGLKVRTDVEPPATEGHQQLPGPPRQ